MKQTQAPGPSPSPVRAALPALALLAVLLLPSAARAQWTTNGGNTVTTTPNSVGVGTTNPAYGKLQINKSVRIDDDTASTAGSDTINAAPSLYLGTAGGGGQFQYNSGGGLDLWQYNGSWRRTITFARTGWVGIGTTAPKNLFHVDGGSSSGGITVSGWSAGMGFRDNGAGADAKLYQWRSEGGQFRMALVNDAESDFVRQNILVANAAGNIGMGTTPSSSSRLHVLGGNIESQYSTAAGQGYGLFVARDNNHFVENAYLDSASGQWRAIQTGKSAMLSTNTAGGTALTVAADDTARAGGASRDYASLLTVRMDGKVGIGNPAPGYKLDVAGQVHAAGGFVFPDGTVQTTAAAGGGNGTLTGITAGAGLTGGGTSGSITLENNDRGSAQNIFKHVANAAGVAQFSAASNNDALSFEGTGGTTVSFVPGSKRIVINSAASSASGWTEASGSASLSTTNGAARVGVGTGSPLGPLSVGDSSAVGSDGYLVIGKNSGAGMRHFRVGFDQNFNFVIGDYGLNNTAGAWASPFAINWQAPSNSLYINSGGVVGIGTATPGAGLTDTTVKLDVQGSINVSGNINAKYQDVAEWVPTVQKLAPGTVVILDADRSNHVMASAGAYDTKVAGVVSAQPGVILGVAGDDKVKVATTGRVKVKVDASRGAIKVGDLLVTSEVEGVAMKSVPVNLGGTPIHRPGTIIGKALEPLEKGMGEILVLLSLQ